MPRGLFAGLGTVLPSLPLEVVEVGVRRTFRSWVWDGGGEMTCKYEAREAEEEWDDDGYEGSPFEMAMEREDEAREERRTWPATCRLLTCLPPSVQEASARVGWMVPPLCSLARSLPSLPRHGHVRVAYSPTSLKHPSPVLWPYVARHKASAA